MSKFIFGHQVRDSKLLKFFIFVHQSYSHHLNLASGSSVKISTIWMLNKMKSQPPSSATFQFENPIFVTHALNRYLFTNSPWIKRCTIYLHCIYSEVTNSTLKRSSTSIKMGISSIWKLRRKSFFRRTCRRKICLIQSYCLEDWS